MLTQQPHEYRHELLIRGDAISVVPFRSVKVLISHVKLPRWSWWNPMRWRTPQLTCVVTVGSYHLPSLLPCFKDTERERLWLKKGWHFFNAVFVVPYHGEETMGISIINQQTLLGVAQVQLHDGSLPQPCFIGNLTLTGPNNRKLPGSINVHLELSPEPVCMPNVSYHIHADGNLDRPSSLCCDLPKSFQPPQEDSNAHSRVPPPPLIRPNSDLSFVQVYPKMGLSDDWTLFSQNSDQEGQDDTIHQATGRATVEATPPPTHPCPSHGEVNPPKVLGPQPPESSTEHEAHSGNDRGSTLTTQERSEAMNTSHTQTAALQQSPSNSHVSRRSLLPPLNIRRPSGSNDWQTSRFSAQTSSRSGASSCVCTTDYYSSLVLTIHQYEGSIQQQEDANSRQAPQRVVIMARVGQIEWKTEPLTSLVETPNIETTFIFPYYHSRILRFLVAEKLTESSRRSSCEDGPNSPKLSSRQGSPHDLCSEYEVLGLGKLDLASDVDRRGVAPTECSGTPRSAASSPVSRKSTENDPLCWRPPQDTYFRAVQLYSLDGTQLAGQLVVSIQFVHENLVSRGNCVKLSISDGPIGKAQ